MEWYVILAIIIGSFLVLLVSGMPVAFCFLLINLVAGLIFFGGLRSATQIIFSIFGAVTRFEFLPLPLFVLMGDVMFYSGIAPLMMDAIDKWLGRVPGRLSLVAVAAGTLFGTLSGSSIGSTALLGTVLVPEMKKRGYKNPMSLGPILGSGGLAMMIPPSALAVLLGAIAEIDIGKLLIAIIIPGLLMATFYATYVIGRCWLQPELAPAYEVGHIPLSEKLLATVKYILPLAFIIFSCLGVLFLAIASPTEAAATGALSTFILAAAYRKLNWKVIKESVRSTAYTTGMVLLIFCTVTFYSQILAISGASRGLAAFAMGLPVAPIMVIISMIIVGLILGMFMSAGTVMMICLPMFMPIVRQLGFDVVWFGAIFLLIIEIGTTSPPFGLGLFTMKAVAPPDVTLADCYRAALPFIYCDLAVTVLMIAFPIIPLWLPSMGF